MSLDCRLAGVAVALARPLRGSSAGARRVPGHAPDGDDEQLAQQCRGQGVWVPEIVSPAPDLGFLHPD